MHRRLYTLLSKQQCVSLPYKPIRMKFIICLLLFVSSFVFAQSKETISREEARINDKIKLSISYAEFIDRYKAPDSTATPAPDETCSKSKEVKLIYYKGVTFEWENEMLTFKSINFSKRRSMYLSIPDDWFDHTTTLKNFMKGYPEESEFIEDYETADGEELKRIILMPTDLAENYEWWFLFKNGKLKSIDCHYICR
jgi:hypothetical protein